MTRLDNLLARLGFQGSPPVTPATQTTLQHKEGIPYKELPDGLLCAVRDPEIYRHNKRVISEWELAREASHIQFVLDLLDFAEEHDSRFSIRELFDTFKCRGLGTWHHISEVGKRLEKAGVLTHGQGRKPREVNFDAGEELWCLGMDWIEREPEYTWFPGDSP